MPKRPINLALYTMRFPITAIVSILHRLSGVLIFLGLPYLFYLLKTSLSSLNEFTALQDCLSQHSYSFFALYFILSALIYHVLAGTKHLLMDLGFGEHLQTAKCLSWLVLVLTFLFVGLLGWTLW